MCYTFNKSGRLAPDENNGDEDHKETKMVMKRSEKAKPATEKKAKPAPKKKVEKVQEEEVPLPEEPIEPETAVTVQETHAIAKPRGTMVKLYDEIENAFVAPFGTLTKIKASNGNCMDSDDNVLGDTIDVQIMSWNRQFVVGPCDNNAPSELVKYSHERAQFEDGSGSLNDFVQELRDEGWVNAAVKEYYEIVGVLLKAGKKSDLVDELVQLQLSPTSVKSFEGFRLQTAFKIARGLLPENAAEEVTVTAEVVTSRGNSWTKFNFKPKSQA